MLQKSADAVVFMEDKVEEAFLSLPETDEIKKAIRRAIEKLKQNIFYGENIPKKQIPREYIQKYDIDNLRWCQLTSGWRLVYSVVSAKVEILAVILEYFNHKDYEKRFKY